jgi:DNA-binding GntR family transcriptional regulator
MFGQPMPTRKSNTAPSPIDRSTLHSQLVGTLRDMIVEVRLAPGERIDEKALCEAFGVSRTPLREALKVLASEGLVELPPNRSARTTSISQEGVEDLFEVISWLDFNGAKAAAEKATEKDIQYLRSIHRQLLHHHDAGERTEYYRLNREFHIGIIDLAGNSVLSAVYAGLMAQAQRMRYVAIQSQAHWDRGIEEHEQILAALAEGDDEKASRLLFDHVRETGRQVAQSLAAS